MIMGDREISAAICEWLHRRGKKPLDTKIRFEFGHDAGGHYLKASTKVKDVKPLPDARYA